MKILSGRWGGRILKAPKGPQTRPTLALTRKAVFDIAQFELEGATVLDLFAGSGAMGIEALSRGAAHVTFVDKSREALQCIRENLQMFDAENLATLIQTDALTALKKLSAQHKIFSFVYIDPPYDAVTTRREVLTYLDQSTLFSPNALLFIEEGTPGKGAVKPPTLQSLTLISSRHFGKSTLHQYRKT